MKYIISILALLLLVFGMSACAPDEEPPEELPTEPDEEPPEEPDEESPEDDDIEETLEEDMISEDDEVEIGEMV